jgi:hypothetical protein
MPGRSIRVARIAGVLAHEFLAAGRVVVVVVGAA